MFSKDNLDEIAQSTGYETFMRRVVSNLHIGLTLSPIGESFRSRIRNFPSLVNCCGIDWVSKWP
jgi:dynein heavy chain